MTNVFALTQRAYRFFNDDGSETSESVAAAENAALTIKTNVTNPRTVLRISLAETGAGSISGAATDDYQLQVSKNAGAFANVTNASATVKGFDSSNLTDGNATTNSADLSNPGSGSFVAGEICEDGLLDNLQITANNYTEFLYTLEVVDADVAHNDSLTFRVLKNGATTNMTYTVTPTITVDKGKRYGVGTPPWTWNSTVGTKWAATSGGAGGLAVPTSADDVFFDANSGSGTITFDGNGNLVAKNLNFTGYTGTFNSDGTGSQRIDISGNLTLGAGATYDITHVWAVAFAGTGTQTFTSNGKSVRASPPDGGLIVGPVGGGTLQFADAASVRGINAISGTADLNNLSHTVSYPVADATSAAGYLLGTGTLTVTGYLDFTGNPANLTVTPSSSTVKCTADNASVFRGAGKTYNNLWLSPSTGGQTVEGSNTFNDLKLDATFSYKFLHDTCQTVSTFTVPNSASNAITINSDDDANPFTLSKASGTVTVKGCTIEHSIATGGAVWNALTSDTNVDAGGNTGWVFTSGVSDHLSHTPTPVMGPVQAQ